MLQGFEMERKTGASIYIIGPASGNNNIEKSSCPVCLPKIPYGLEIVELTSDTRKLLCRSATADSEVF